MQTGRGGRWLRSSVMGCLLAISACSEALPPITDCRDAKQIHPICGFKNPEDLAVLPDEHRLVVSQFAHATTQLDAAGSLAVLDLRSEAFRVAYPPADRSPRTTPSPGWGDERCPGAPTPLNPHGIDLAQREDGRWQLLVVNHGGRESIEFFEVLLEPEDVKIVWRGCAIAPEQAYFNDVVHVPGGGFLATHMLERDSLWLGTLSAMIGRDTGNVREWQAGRGYRAVRGTEAPFPNGIEISPDGRDIYLNAYMAGEVRRISRETGELLARAEVPGPDNLSWSQDGRLLVASHVGTLSELRVCMSLEEGTCPMPFEIVALDPQDLEGGAIFANRGPPMGGGTIAVHVGNELVIGSFAGDRVIRARVARRSPAL